MLFMQITGKKMLFTKLRIPLQHLSRYYNFVLLDKKPAFKDFHNLNSRISHCLKHSSFSINHCTAYKEIQRENSTFADVIKVSSNTKKCIYSEHPDVADGTEEEIQSFYQASNISVRGPDVPKPFAKFSELCLPDQQALTALKMALMFNEMSYVDDAEKLFEHAIALSPNNHEVLLHYSDFLKSLNDFINANRFYLRAMTSRTENYSPVLAKPRRTLPVIQFDHEKLRRIDSKRERVGILNNRDPSLNRLKKEIDFLHIHHTVAIGGNTMSLAEIRTVGETRMAVSGKSILKRNEILGLESALQYVNQTSAKDNAPITVTDILEIHRRVMGHVDPTTAGTFRKGQVSVGEYIPPDASNVESLMDTFIASLESRSFYALHAVHQAAFAHHQLVFIHPFLDGNGRTARLLMNLVFRRCGYQPIIIRKEERSKYFKYLQIAHEGNNRPFYGFIADAAEYSYDMLSYMLHAHELESQD